MSIFLEISFMMISSRLDLSLAL